MKKSFFTTKNTKDHEELSTDETDVTDMFVRKPNNILKTSAYICKIC